MTLESEGTRRLTIVCGVIGAIAWIVFIGKVSNGFSDWLNRFSLLLPLFWLLLAY
jgi:hypothetical protein